MVVTTVSTVVYPENWTAALKDAQQKIPAEQFNRLKFLFAAAVGDAEQIDKSMHSGMSIQTTNSKIDHANSQLILLKGYKQEDRFTRLTACDIACIHANEKALRTLLRYYKDSEHVCPSNLATHHAAVYMSFNSFKAIIAACPRQSRYEILKYRIMDIVHRVKYIENRVVDGPQKVAVILQLFSHSYYSLLINFLKEALNFIPSELLKICAVYIPPFCPDFINCLAEERIYPLFDLINVNQYWTYTESELQIVDPDRKSIVKLLLEAGADPVRLQIADEPIIDYARRMNRSEHMRPHYLEMLETAATSETIAANAALAAGIKKFERNQKIKNAIKPVIDIATRVYDFVYTSFNFNS